MRLKVKTNNNWNTCEKRTKHLREVENILKIYEKYYPSEVAIECLQNLDMQPCNIFEHFWFPFSSPNHSNLYSVRLWYQYIVKNLIQAGQGIDHVLETSRYQTQGDDNEMRGTPWKHKFTQHRSLKYWKDVVSSCQKRWTCRTYKERELVGDWS